MPLIGFDELYERADCVKKPVGLAVAGAADLTVLQAVRSATDRGWVRPILVDNSARIRDLAATERISLDGFQLLEAEGEEAGVVAVAEARSGRAAFLMKGQISTPSLMHAVNHPETGLRTGRVVAQVVLMEILASNRRFLLADTGVTIAPKTRSKIEILLETVQVAHALDCPEPRVALMAATETVNTQMPETLDAVELQKRGEMGEFPGCIVQGPLSFDLAYANDAGMKKRIGGGVVGAADAMIFPNLLAANLTVKAIMYTAECRFGGVLRGVTHPVVFMSRADTVSTRLNSIALALRLI